MEVTREVVLEAPLEEVWSALTEPERLEEWFANDVELELEPGGEGTFRWDDGEERHAVVEEVEPERRFAFTWDESHVCDRARRGRGRHPRRRHGDGRCRLEHGALAAGARVHA